MEKCIKCEISLKQKAKENTTLRTQRLFGFIRNVYCKLNHSKSAIHFPVYGTAKMLKNHELEVAQKKAEAIEFLRRRALTI